MTMIRPYSVMDEKSKRFIYSEFALLVEYYNVTCPDDLHTFFYVSSNLIRYFYTKFALLLQRILYFVKQRRSR